MLQELLDIFRGSNPLRAMADNFSRMVELALDSTLKAGGLFFNHKAPPAERSYIYEQDIKINQMQRAIRKQVATHAATASSTVNVPYCLVLMSLVKDLERIGDYAKNIVEILDLHPEPLPEDELVEELKEIRREVETIFRSSPEILSGSDRQKAQEHVLLGKDLAHRCDALLTRIARSDYDAATAAAMVLGTRYYKRIGGHLTNVLSSVVMPLHKVDYYDEEEIQKMQDDR